MTFEEMFRAAYAFTAPSIEIGHVLNARQAARTVTQQVVRGLFGMLRGR
jgi:hypothetical protein